MIPLLLALAEQLDDFRVPRLAGKPVWNSNLEFRSLKSLPVSLN